MEFLDENNFERIGCIDAIPIPEFKSAVILYDNEIYSYDMIGDAILVETEGKLIEVKKDYAELIENALKINSVENYNVKVVEQLQ